MPGTDLVDFVVSVPSTGAHGPSSGSFRFSGSAVKRYSEFEKFATALDQLCAARVRAQLSRSTDILSMLLASNGAYLFTCC